jgi:hypothetical protein
MYSRSGQGVWMKPANGFEPMAFALQKRCSTAELSRQCGTRAELIAWAEPVEA